jgi:hypothetical protein
VLEGWRVVDCGLWTVGLVKGGVKEGFWVRGGGEDYAITVQFSLYFLPPPIRFATPIAFPPFRFPPFPSFPSSSSSSPSRFLNLSPPTLTLPPPLPNKLPDFRVLAGVS